MKFVVSRQELNSFLSELLQEGIVLQINESEILLGVGRLKRACRPDGPSFYVSDFFLEEPNPYLISPQTHRVSKSDLISCLQQSIGNNTGDGATNIGDRVPIERIWTEPDRSDFIKQFQLVKHKIQQGALAKAVPVVFSKSQGALSHSERQRVLLNALTQPNGGWLYGYWNGDGGLLGFTPEILFSKNNNKLRTMALAGTAPVETAKMGTEHDLEETQAVKAAALSGHSGAMAADPKLLAEHEFVVSDLLEQLRPLGKVCMQPLTQVRYGPMYHLQTAIEVVVDSSLSFSDLVQRIHPTPALGVSPRSCGIHWLKEISESQRQRGVFGGPFGFCSDEFSFCLVAIRNLIWDKHTTFLGTGFGQIAESETEVEWAEVLLKRKSVMQALLKKTAETL